MSTPALRVEDVSKMYRLGEVGTGSLSHDLNRAWARLRGRPDPFAKVGVVNDRTAEGSGNFVWALRDINFQVNEGDIVGIVGRNGAGKSTLLKLLSRVTAPTEGRIFVNGRIASLLEVGTGFHPDLTGRENIFLNGAILGMSKQEIRARFDEIVEFSGCAKYIDTPVKRYSSGMHVRLAFAVAAHLETDILIVDEVLAVGDAEFQQRCLGKMQDLSRSSRRTVLFVSHNMAAVRQLCPNSILMDQGTVVNRGETGRIIEQYMDSGIRNSKSRVIFSEKSATSQAKMTEASVYSGNSNTHAVRSTDQEINIVTKYEIRKPIRNKRLNISLFDALGNLLFTTSDFHESKKIEYRMGLYESLLTIPAHLLNTGKYKLTFCLDIPNELVLHLAEEALFFEISDFAFDQTGITLNAMGEITSPFGLIHPKLKWNVRGLI
ncbi:MAG: ABC transporter ATP-binding protein [Minwuia sp.]|nr:ABC transporter ATP-binding protein [Minwuia sp.]